MKEQGGKMGVLVGLDLLVGHNNCKYPCTQHRGTSIHKTNTNRHKREIDRKTITVGDFNTPLTPMDRSSKQKINKETQVLNDTLDEMDLIDIFRTFHPNAEEYTFSNAHGTFSRIDHILGHKSNLSEFKKIEIISSIFSNHNAMRPGIDYKKKKKSVRNTNTWSLNNTFLNNQQVTEKNQKGNKKISRNN